MLRSDTVIIIIIYFIILSSPGPTRKVRKVEEEEEISIGPFSVDLLVSFVRLLSLLWNCNSIILMYIMILKIFWAVGKQEEGKESLHNRKSFPR